METALSRSLYDDENIGLGSYEALLFALVLETSLLQLRILEAKSTRGHVPDVQLTPHKEKLFRDRRTVSEMARATFAELLQGGRYTCLRTLLHSMREVRERAAALRATNHRLRLVLKEEVQAGRLQRARHVEEMSAADDEAATLRDTLEDDALNSEMRLNYVERWQCARAELLEVSAQQTRSAAPRERGARQLQQEERVHRELVRMFNVATEEYERSVECWEERYHADLADINTRLMETRKQLRETLAKRKRLEELYSAHAGEIAAWLKVKKERAERLALEAERAASARRLQAWWRGVMVRRGIGAFKSLRAKKQPQKQGKKK